MNKIKRGRSVAARLCQALGNRGYYHLSIRSSKYQAFEEKPGGRVFFVGRMGAFRQSPTCNVSDSMSIEGGRTYTKLLQEVPE